jgi:(2Fe-2S) ferredoxin
MPRTLAPQWAAPQGPLDGDRACEHARLRMPHRARYLFVCTNRRADDHPKGSCAQKGSEEIVKALKAALVQRGVAKDVVRACSSSCLDLCEIGISIVQEPEHVAYGNVSLADVDAIADAAAKGEIVERLVVHRPRTLLRDPK